MMAIFTNGGFPMYFILAFGLVALATAFVFAMNPHKDREGFLRWMSRATLFSILSGTAADLAAVASYVGSHELEGTKLAAVIVQGLGESLSPSILGFSLLSLVAVMTAVGKRRLDARGAAIAVAGA